MEDKIFNNDPIYMKSLLGKEVAVETIENRRHCGVVYVVDPVYKTVVLTNEGANTVEFIMHQAIKSFQIVSDETRKEFLMDTNKMNSITYEVMQRKRTLMNWLREMFIKVEEDGDYLKVDEHLRIGPPYGIDDCYCDNTIILQRIKNLIEQMPVDFL